MFAEFICRVIHREPKTLTHEDIKQLIDSEIRGQLISNAKTESKYASYPPVKNLPDAERLRILVTGGSGFVGSHLVDRLMMAGHHVIVVDNMFTGRQKNIAQWLGHPNFQLIIHDVVEPIMLEVDQIYHLACPASPPHYQVCCVCLACSVFTRLAVQSHQDYQDQYRGNSEHAGSGQESLCSHAADLHL